MRDFGGERQGRRGRVATCLLAAGLIAGLAPAAATAVTDPPPLQGPDAIQQPVEDGCQRNPAGLLTFSSPEWVFVYSGESFNPNPASARRMEGTAAFADTASGDLPQNHGFYDFNTDVVLDPGYEYLLGGSPGDQTGNYGEGGGLHIEWETGTLPPWAWATDDDRLKNWGSWVWDCGHWGQGFGADPNDPSGSAINDTDYFLPGTNQTGGLRGEGTEFHPQRAVTVTRNAPYLPDVAETEADFFASTDGNAAYAEATCALTNGPPDLPPGVPPAAYPPGWTACVQNPASWRQPVNDRDYSFFVPAPPKPGPAAHLRYRVETISAGKGPQEQVDVLSDGIRVKVPFGGFGNSTERLVFGKRFFVGWDGQAQDFPAQVRVRLKRLTVIDSLDTPGVGTSAGVPPGEYGLYIDVNGFWKFLNDWAPGLAAVNDGQSFDLDRNLDLYVPAGKELSLRVDGRECDLPRIEPCPATSEVAEDNDDPGTAGQSFPSVQAALGDHTLTSPAGHWQLTYSVTQIRASGHTTGAGPCSDTFLPRSRIRRQGPHAVNGRVVLAGVSTDTNCDGPGAASRRVRVSVARLVPPISAPRTARYQGDRCQFLQRSGNFSLPRSCQQMGFLLARGTASWTFARRANLKPGTYLIRTRAVDRAGNVEYVNLRRNRLVFTVR